MTTTNYDAEAANVDRDGACTIAADLTAKERIHVHHLAVIRLAKAALVEAIKTGAVLHEQRNRLDVGLSLSEAECYMRFHEESGVRTEQLSPAVEVKLPRVLELLGQLNAGLPRNEPQPRGTSTTESAGSSPPKATAYAHVCDAPAKQASEPSKALDQPAKAPEHDRYTDSVIACRVDMVLPRG